jgi:hypothetical protein
MIVHYQRLGRFERFDINIDDTWPLDDKLVDDEDADIDNIDDLLDDEEVDPDDEPEDLCDDEE